MLEQVEWGEFKLGDLFEIQSSKAIFHANNIETIFDSQVEGSLPYVVRTTQNNGIRGYIIKDEQFANDGNTLSFAQDTFSVFYQRQRYFTGNKVKVLKPKFSNANENIYQFICACFQKSLETFTRGTGSTVDTIAETKIQLPTKNGGIYFDFINKFIAELEKGHLAEIEEEHLTELEAYLETTGLKNYELTSDELGALKNLEEGKIEWKVFRIEEVLNWMPQKEIDPLKLKELTVEGNEKYPFYGQSTANNGVISYEALNDSVLNNENGLPTILIHSNNQNVVYLETPFYLKDGHGATSVLQKENLNKLNAMFLMATISKIITQKFSYQTKATKIALKNTKIELPIKNSEIDYEFMEIFTSAIQKLVIKDVVIYNQERIKATAEIINN